MGSSLGQSKVADLSFQVFGRALHPDWFAVRAHRRVALDGWQADIRIVDGGHAVLWRSGDVLLTEVLAGPSTSLPEPGLLFHSPIRHERAAALRPRAGVEYQTCFEVERVDPEVFAHLCDEMTLDAHRDRLFHRSSDFRSDGPVGDQPPGVRVEGQGAAGPRLPLVPGRAGDRPDPIAVRSPTRVAGPEVTAGRSSRILSEPGSGR